MKQEFATDVYLAPEDQHILTRGQLSTGTVTSTTLDTAASSGPDIGSKWRRNHNMNDRNVFVVDSNVEGVARGHFEDAVDKTPNREGYHFGILRSQFALIVPAIPQVNDVWSYNGHEWKITSVDSDGSAPCFSVGNGYRSTLSSQGLKDGAYIFVRNESPAPTPVVLKRINHVAIVVDKSGSMNHLCEATRKALNKTLDDLAVESRRTGILTYVSLFEFGDHVRQVYHNKFISAVTPEITYLANMGMTALFDATGQAIEALIGISPTKDADEAYLLIVLTDGHENQSRKFSGESLKSLMAKVQGTDRWTLTFLLPPGSKSSFCHQFRIPEGNVAEWEQSTQGVEEASRMSTASVSSYFTARSVGATKSVNFYTTDASTLTKADLTNKLTNISGQVKVWQVDKEVDIADFVQDKGHTYQRGTCFYQLSKDEKNIQDYKKLLIMEKGTKNVYSGDQARTLLGLPIGVSVKVKPGNHGNFDIFVQSTSLNRKLVRGTKLVYNPGASI